MTLRKFLVRLFLELKEILFLLQSLPNPWGRSSMQRFGIRFKKLDTLESRLFSSRIETETSLEFDRSYLSSPDDVARRCFEKKGIYPISFSWPGGWSSPVEKSKLLSSIVPGLPYSFADPSLYLREYQDSAFAFTFKKGGWDCFRHLEILASGCIPVMPDVHEIPPFTMVHYPKRLLRSVLEQESLATSEYSLMRPHTMAQISGHLSSEQMAKYLLRCAGYQGGRILFIDESLSRQADYLSVLTLIGLKQLLGKDLHVAHPVPYMYENYSGDLGVLYGRGFGYTKVVSESCMNENEARGLAVRDYLDIDSSYFSDFAKVVFGNLTDSRGLIGRFEQSVHSEKGIYLRGDDRAPTRSEYSAFRRFRGMVFSREIY